MNNKTNNTPFIPHLCEPAAILGLILVGELLALVLVLANEQMFTWQLLGSISLISQWIILTCALILCQCRQWLNQWPRLYSGAMSYGICLLVSAIVLVVAHRIDLNGLDKTIWFKHFFISAIFSGILLRYLYLQQQLRNKQKSELEAKLQALQSRIRPHFLFNSMNTIASLISVNPQAAETVVEDLSSLFRSSLEIPSLVLLKNEIELCRRYIAIEQQRLNERLTMHWHLPELLPDVLVPSLFLQPLLENAIIHGIQRLTEGGEINLSVYVIKNALHCKIENPTSELDVATLDSGNQMALDNIQHRLDLHFGKQAKISNRKENNIYSVEIIIPCDEAGMKIGKR